MDTTASNVEFIKPSYEITIGSRSADVLEVKLRYGGLEVNQNYIVTVVNGFALSFTLSYIDEETKKELYAVIEKIKL